MNRCIHCNIEKPVAEFTIRKDTGKHLNVCKSCRNIQSKKWVSNNLEKRREIALAWAKRNYPYIRKKKAEYRARDPLRVRRWAIENPEKMNACRRAWDKRNPHRKLQHARNRQAGKLRAIPQWANQTTMDVIYRLARIYQMITGGVWEVDHIVPLRGRTVCGLHCEDNLQVVPQAFNRKKGRFTWPDMA